MHWRMLSVSIPVLGTTSSGGCLPTLVTAPCYICINSSH
jgi:hypothetical protein